MAWVTVTKEDLKNYVVSDLVDAIDEAALGDAQVDRFTTIHKDVIASVRMACSANPKNVLDVDDTKIPSSLRPFACWIIVQFMATGLGVELTEAQIGEITNAREELKTVADKRLPIEMPDNADPTPDAQSGSAVQLVSFSPRVYTRDSMAGL